MKVLLAAINAKYIHSNLAVFSLKKYADSVIGENNENIDIEIAEYTINNHIGDILPDLYSKKADIIAFSVYIWNVEYVTRLAGSLKKIMPHTEIWVGGPEVSYRAESFLKDYPFVDRVLCGEGEKIFADSLIKASRKEAFGKIIYCDDVISMNELPYVYDNLKPFENKIIYYESARGCPFSCSYCLSSIDKKIRVRDTDLVKAELKKFIDNRISLVKFVDRTFNAVHSHAMDIWKFLAENDNGVTRYHFELAADILRDDEIEFLQGVRKGLFQFEIGIQTFNEETLSAINRKTDTDRLCSNVRKLWQMRNIHIHLDLIAGLPYEDLESFAGSFDNVYALRPDEFQLGFLKVLYGSEMEKDSSLYDIVTADYPPYEVLSTRWLSYDDVLLLKEVEEALEVYYNSRQFDNAISYLAENYESPFDMYRQIGAAMAADTEVGAAKSRLKRYDFLYNYGRKVVDNPDLFMELLIHDAYLRDNCKTRPSFAERENDVSGGICRDRRISARLYHAEKYSYDVDNFIKTGNVIKNDTIILYDYGKRDDITYNVEYQCIEE